ncbi:hypothetical protein B0T14DRAFT_565391 [Immersiella caudata]|uniref:Uncharacterized protein n=1 Tax=Immersiella caudata TaxID=314043 RepID=A0AA39WYS2_9PEZI|nr:hypothetical protein B0T14DRAFT_565391 [Immersiella caudata]
MPSQPTRQPKPQSSRYNDSTPPDDGDQLTLTPLATDERPARKWDTSDAGKAMQMFQAFRDGTSLEQDKQSLGQYVDDKVRFDYDPTNSLLTVRMPSPAHEFFKTLLAHDIQDQLKRIAEQGDEASKFAARIKDGCSSRIFLRENLLEEALQAPEHAFQHLDVAYLGVVLEVSYAQDGKNLKNLAYDYILRSNGDIKVVIGVDINNGKETTVSLWRPNYVKEEDEEFEIFEVRQDISYQPFRSSDGSPVNGEDSLQLSLSDFATDEILSGYESTTLSIPFRRLVDLLTQAEEVRQAREAESGLCGIRSKRKTRKRKATFSPADELRSEDEAKYQRPERDVAERAAADDGEYERPGRRRRT